MICAMRRLVAQPVGDVESDRDVHRRPGRPEQRDGQRQGHVGDLLADARSAAPRRASPAARPATTGSRWRRSAARSSPGRRCRGRSARRGPRSDSRQASPARRSPRSARYNAASPANAAPPALAPTVKANANTPSGAIHSTQPMITSRASAIASNRPTSVRRPLLRRCA